MPAKVEISHKTIIFTILFLLLLWVLFLVKEILFLVFVAFILMSALKPWADTLEKFHIPRTLSILSIYIFIISLLIFTGSSVIPPLVTQSIHLGERFPGYIRSVLPFISIDSQTLIQQITPLGENVVKVTFGLFGNIVASFTLLVVSFYLLIGRKNLEVNLTSLMGEKGANKIIVIIWKVEERLGAWVRGQVALALTIGLSTFIGLMLLGIPYTFPLAILAGILEIVPTIGPILSAIPAILVALTISPFLALAVTALYFGIQQLEGHIVVPLVMKRVVGMPPLVTIIAILMGAKLAGIGGALLAVPTVVTIESVLSEYLKLKESK